MKYCCVPGCKEPGGFKFPENPRLRNKWRRAIRREGPKKKLWKPTNHSVVCAKHFTEDDFAVSPIPRLRCDLVRGAVPSVFSFKAKTVSERSLRLKVIQNFC